MAKISRFFKQKTATDTYEDIYYGTESNYVYMSDADNNITLTAKLDLLSDEIENNTSNIDLVMEGTIPLLAQQVDSIDKSVGSHSDSIRDLKTGLNDVQGSVSNLSTTVNNIPNIYVEKDGDTMTGGLTVPSITLTGGPTLSYDSSLEAIKITF